MWAQASNIAEVYKIGKLESKACSNLLTEIPTNTGNQLAHLVKLTGDKSRDRLVLLCIVIDSICYKHRVNPRLHSMKFITHEALAGGVFNKGYSSATAAQSAWAQHLTNDDALLEILLKRMEQDYLALNSKLRKAWSHKDVVPRLDRMSYCALSLFDSITDGLTRGGM